MRRSKPYNLHAEAQEEIHGAYLWYSERSPDATVGFLSRIDESLELISRNPLRWPYSVVYLDQPDAVTIVAVAHHKRRPGYWKTRM